MEVETAASGPGSRCLVIFDEQIRAFLEVAMSFLGHSCQHEPVDRTWRLQYFYLSQPCFSWGL